MKQFSVVQCILKYKLFSLLYMYIYTALSKLQLYTYVHDASFECLTLSHVRMHGELDQETWLKDAVLSIFPDTRDCSPSLVRCLNMDHKRINDFHF